MTPDKVAEIRARINERLQMIQNNDKGNIIEPNVKAKGFPFFECCLATVTIVAILATLRGW